MLKYPASKGCEQKSNTVCVGGEGVGWTASSPQYSALCEVAAMVCNTTLSLVPPPCFANEVTCCLLFLVIVLSNIVNKVNDKSTFMLQYWNMAFYRVAQHLS